MDIKAGHYEGEHAKDLLRREMAARAHVLAPAIGDPSPARPSVEKWAEPFGLPLILAAKRMEEGVEVGSSGSVIDVV